MALKKKPRGKALEDMLDFTHKLYKNQCRADVVKRQVKTVFDKKNNTMNYVKSEGFDYEGTTAPHGRSICIEAKEELRDRLYVDKKNKQGLKLRQLEALLFRASLGACSAVIWLHTPNEAFLLDWYFLRWFYEDVYKKDIRKSITVDLLLKNNQHQVMVNGMVDYLDVLIKC